MAKRKPGQPVQQDKQSREQLLTQLKDALERTLAGSRDVQQVLQEIVDGDRESSSRGTKQRGS